MTIRYLRNIKDGTIYEWDPILAENPLCEEVSEEVAFPERFVPKTQRGRKSKLELGVGELPEAALGNPDVDAEASRGIQV